MNNIIEMILVLIFSLAYVILGFIWLNSHLRLRKINEESWVRKYFNKVGEITKIKLVVSYRGVGGKFIARRKKDSYEHKKIASKYVFTVLSIFTSGNILSDPNILSDYLAIVSPLIVPLRNELLQYGITLILIFGGVFTFFIDTISILMRFIVSKLNN